MPVACCADSVHVVGHFYFVRKDKMQLDEPEPCATFATIRKGVSFFVPARGASNPSNVRTVGRGGAAKFSGKFCHRFA